MANEDRYANIASIKVTASAANAITFQELQTQLGFASGQRDKALAMLIDQIDYYPDVGAIGEMTASGDYIRMGITLASTLTSLVDVTAKSVVDVVEFIRQDFGTAASARLQVSPVSKQFFPPIIHAERQLYLGIETNGLASAAVGRARIFYRTLEISPAEMIELVETFRLVG